MKRLTFEGNFCDIAQCRELPCPYDNNCTQKQVWERLQAYEGTGLMPAEVHSMSGEWCAMMSVLTGIGSYARLRELAEADRDGRLVVLPTADAGAVVRCKDCKHFKNYGRTSLLIDGKNIKAGWCHRRVRYDEEYRMPPDGFCSYGKRMEGENDKV